MLHFNASSTDHLGDWVIGRGGVLAIWWAAGVGAGVSLGGIGAEVLTSVGGEIALLTTGRAELSEPIRE